LLSGEGTWQHVVPSRNLNWELPCTPCSDFNPVAQPKRVVTAAQRMPFAAGSSPLPVLTCPLQGKQNVFRFDFTLAAFFKIRLAKAVGLRKEKVKAAAIIGSVRAARGKCEDMKIIRGGFWTAMYLREGSVNGEHRYENQAFGRSPRR